MVPTSSTSDDGMVHNAPSPREEMVASSSASDDGMVHNAPSPNEQIVLPPSLPSDGMDYNAPSPNEEMVPTHVRRQHSLLLLALPCVLQFISLMMVCIIILWILSLTI